MKEDLITREQFIFTLRSLANLLENPEPGISSWHMMCSEAAECIERGLKQQRG